MKRQIDTFVSPRRPYVAKTGIVTVAVRFRFGLPRPSSPHQTAPVRAIPDAAASDPRSSESAGGDAADGPLEERMERFLDGDTRAFEELFHMLAPRLERSLRFLSGDRHLAEDLTQTTFLKVLRARDTYQRGMAVEAWVWAIARHAFADACRQRRRRPEVLVADPEHGAPAAEPERSADAEHLAEALLELPAAQREALVLLKVQGLSAGEAAEAAGTTVGGIKMRAQRAYETLRRVLRRPNEP
jgi:RNA polymerase sigma-70 factor, ECF subfamily